MRIGRSQLKELAIENMHASVPKATMVTLVYLLLTTVVQNVLSLFVPSVQTDLTTEEFYALLERFNALPETLMRQLSSSLQISMMGVFLGMLAALFGMVVRFGFRRYTLDLVQGEEAGYHSLTFGFPWTGRVLVLNLLIGLYVFLWSMLGMIVLSVLTVFLGFFVLVPAVFLGVGLIMLVLRYAQAGYVLAENPEIGALAAIRRSKELMVGRTGEYFVLGLSFFGWIILGGLILSLVEAVCGWLHLGGIVGSLVPALVSLPYNMWLTAYRELTYTHYYLALTNPPQQKTTGGDSWIGPDRSY